MTTLSFGVEPSGCWEGAATAERGINAIAQLQMCLTIICAILICIAIPHRSFQNWTEM
jgi:hypothetical protein